MMRTSRQGRKAYVFQLQIKRNYFVENTIAPIKSMAIAFSHNHPDRLFDLNSRSFNKRICRCNNINAIIRGERHNMLSRMKEERQGSDVCNPCLWLWLI